MGSLDVSYHFLHIQGLESTYFFHSYAVVENVMDNVDNEREGETSQVSFDAHVLNVWFCCSTVASIGCC